MMLRILWILSLALIVGAHRYDSWKSFFETLAHDLDHTLQKSSSIFPEVSTVSSYTKSASKKPCESYSNCHPDSMSSSTASTTTSKPGTFDDYDLRKDAPGSTPQQQVGSVKGTPGETFPDYTEIPDTSFSCSDKKVPGFYADLESGCQVFHACWPHRRESFLCPVGTTFNQALLACDYWYSSNCSLSPHYYNVNGYSMKSTDETENTPEGSMINFLLGTEKEPSKEELHKITSELDTIEFISQFLPVKAKVTIYPETSDSKSKIVATASIGKRTKRDYSTTESQDFTREPQSTTEAVVTDEAQYSTRSPPHCSETIKYINTEAAVRLVFERLDNVLKNILREVKEYMAANAANKLCSTAHSEDKVSVLTKIKHKLVPRPLVPPMVKEEDPIITSKTDAAVDTIVTKSPVADLYKKPVDSKIKHSKLSISPLTKKTLVESYIKLLKLRKS